MPYGFENILGNQTQGYNPMANSEIELLKQKMAEQQKVIDNMQKQMQGNMPLKTKSMHDYENSDRFLIIMGKHVKALLANNGLVANAIQGMPEYKALCDDINKDFMEFEKSYSELAQQSKQEVNNNAVQ